MNSIGDKLQDRAGQRLTAHFRSNIKARFRSSKAWLKSKTLPSHPVIAACHVRGRGTSKLQWHIQVNGILSPDIKEPNPNLMEFAQADSVRFASLAPDYEASLTAEQWHGSQGYVIVSCSPLGELPTDTDSWVKHNNSNPDVTTNVRLQIDVSSKATKLWNEMEQSTFDAIMVIADTQASTLEYWNYDTSKWEKVAQPTRNHTRRINFLFHEASTLYMADDLTKDKTASVDSTYRPYGLEAGNVFVTGAALFPAAGSWNPTSTICGFAQDLAKKLLTRVSNLKEEIAVSDDDED
jgi:choline dehydrogenase-like flavoprotein